MHQVDSDSLFPHPAPLTNRRKGASYYTQGSEGRQNRLRHDPNSSTNYGMGLGGDDSYDAPASGSRFRDYPPSGGSDAQRYPPTSGDFYKFPNSYSNTSGYGQTPHGQFRPRPNMGMTSGPNSHANVSDYGCGQYVEKRQKIERERPYGAAQHAPHSGGSAPIGNKNYKSNETDELPICKKKAEALLMNMLKLSYPSEEDGIGDVHGEVAGITSLVPYAVPSHSQPAGTPAVPVPPADPLAVAQADPHALQQMLLTGMATDDSPLFRKMELTLAVENLAFVRSEHIAADMAALFSFISRLIPELWVRDIAGNCQRQVEWATQAGLTTNVFPNGEGGYIKFSRLADCDSPYVNLRVPAPNGDTIAFAKRRFIVVTTNCYEAFVMSLLKSDDLFVLPDWSGFRVCWDQWVTRRVFRGPTAAADQPANAEEDADEALLLQHDLPALSEYSIRVRGMGLRARHRHTRGLPCTSIRFAYAEAHLQGSAK